MPGRSFNQPFTRNLAVLLLFGVAFGYLEAAVVVYLRALHEPLRLRFHPQRPAEELFPLLTLDQVRTASPETMRLIGVEIGREAATLLMLAVVALAMARTASQWAAAFAVVFGVWDIVFYLSLKLVLDWPQSLLTQDILFLIPVPWTGPVVAPVTVSAAMIAAGAHLFRLESRGRTVTLAAANWCGLALGAFVIIVSFTLDYGNVMAGGVPQSFNWWIFAAGLSIGLASYGAAARRAGP